MNIRTIAVLGVLLASVLGYWVARIGLRPLLALSNEAQALAPPRLDGRLQTHALAPELAQFAGAFNAEKLKSFMEGKVKLKKLNHKLMQLLSQLIMPILNGSRLWQVKLVVG